MSKFPSATRRIAAARSVQWLYKGVVEYRGDRHAENDAEDEHPHARRHAQRHVEHVVEEPHHAERRHHRHYRAQRRGGGELELEARYKLSVFFFSCFLHLIAEAAHGDDAKVPVVLEAVAQADVHVHLWVFVSDS